MAVSGHVVHAVTIAVLAFLASGFTIGMIDYCFGVFVAEINKNFANWSRTTISAALSFAHVTSCVVSPIVGRLIDGYGARKVETASLLIVAAGFLCLSWVGQLWQLYASYVVLGCGFASAFGLVSGKLVGAWFPVNRGKVMGVVTAGNNFGGMVLVQVATWVARVWGWRASCWAFAIIMAALGLCFMLAVRDAPMPFPVKNSASSTVNLQVPDEVSESGQLDADPGGKLPALALEVTEEEMGQQQQEQGREEEDAQQGSEDDSRPLCAYMKSPMFLSTAFAMVAAFWTYPGVVTHLLPALQAEGLSADEAANCVSMLGAIGICGKLACGWASEKITARVTLGICLVTQCTGLLIFIFGAAEGSAHWSWGAVAFYAAGYGGVGALLPLLCIESFGVKSFGRLYGLISFSFALPSLAAPIAAGYSFDRWRTYKHAFGLATIVFALAVVALVLGRAFTVPTAGGGGKR